MARFLPPIGVAARAQALLARVPRQAAGAAILTGYACLPQTATNPQGSKYRGGAAPDHGDRDDRHRRAWHSTRLNRARPEWPAGIHGAPCSRPRPAGPIPTPAKPAAHKQALQESAGSRSRQVAAAIQQSWLGRRRIWHARRPFRLRAHARVRHLAAPLRVPCSWPSRPLPLPAVVRPTPESARPPCQPKDATQRTGRPRHPAAPSQGVIALAPGPGQPPWQRSPRVQVLWAQPPAACAAVRRGLAAWRPVACGGQEWRRRPVRGGRPALARCGARRAAR